MIYARRTPNFLHPRPGGKIPKATPSACEVHRDWIESQVVLGRNATSIYQC